MQVNGGLSTAKKNSDTGVNARMARRYILWYQNGEAACPFPDQEHGL